MTMRISPSATIGWDIGGAHVKAVLLNADGVVVQALQWPCALWQGLHLLEQALHAMFETCLSSSGINAQQVLHAVTMTGELVDLFEGRQQGVMAIAACLRKQFPYAEFYAADARGVRWLTTVQDNTAAVASMNWHASALCVARQIQHGLVVDIGSTTMDVTACEQGQVIAAGWTDAARMAQGSLLYRGVVRTPLMAFGPYLDWQGQPHALAAEYFATMADVYRVLALLPEAHDMADTADGQNKSVKASLRRLARMVGHDYEEMPEAAWIALAQAFAAQQMELMVDVCRQMLNKRAQNNLNLNTKKQGDLAVAYKLDAPPAADRSAASLDRNGIDSPPLVVLGAGAFLAPTLAQRLGLEVYPAQQLLQAASADMHGMALVCFPAYAVAQLRRTWAF